MEMTGNHHLDPLAESLGSELPDDPVVVPSCIPPRRGRL